MASTASRQLQRAFKEGSIATKLYVLAGLRVCDRVAYDAAHQELQDFTGTVKTFHGCVIEYRKVKDVVAEIEAGQYDHFFDMGTPPQLVSSDFSVVTLSGIEKALWLLKHPGMKSKKKSTVALSHGR